MVVMTTEVLRNMLYAGSRTLLGLGFVVMDEVHYLADRSRGAVWEEVIIHLPESVALVSLSATVSNAEEFGEWLQTVRGDTTTIVEERRPVPLYQHVMVGKRLLDLFASSDIDAAAGFVKEGAPVNDELVRLARDDWASSRMKDRRTPKDKRGRGGKTAVTGRQVGNGRRVWLPSRVDVVDRLDRDGLLPAIVFVFSRVGCEAAVKQCVQANLRLTTPAERDEVHERVETACRHLPDDDLQRAGLPRLPRRPDPRHRRPPRGDAAGLQGGRGGPVHPGPGEGRLRDRDAGAGHQHAGPDRGDREARQVERRDPRGDHAGGVHPADRAGRPSWPRRRGPRGGALAAGHEPARAGRPRVHPHVPPPVELRAVVQHGGQPGPPVRPRAGARAAGAVVRPVPGRQGRGRAGPAAAQGRGGPRRLRRGGDLRPRRLHGVRPDAAGDQRPGEGRGPGPPVRPARGGRQVAGEAAARRRDRGAQRQVRRVRRRGRPRVLRRGASASRRDRRAAGPSPLGRGLPDARGRADAAQGAPQLQQPQPADAPRPGLRPALAHPRPGPAAAARGGRRPRAPASPATATRSTG